MAEYRVKIIEEPIKNENPVGLTEAKPTIFSKNLKKHRVSADVTQKYMAEHLNVSTAAYGKWEVGRREPGTEIIMMIADVLGIPVGELFDRSVK